MSQLTPELVDQLLDHFVDAVHGSPRVGRKSVGTLSVHVDNLTISALLNFSSGSWRRSRSILLYIGHEDVNDLMFTGQRVRWVFDENKNRKYISIDQRLSVAELEEITIPKHLKDTDLCDKQLHASYRSLLSSINWLQSRAQFQAYRSC